MLDKEEVLFAKHKGYLFGAHVVVGLPDCLAEATKGPDAVAIMQHTMALAVDEVDACFLVRCVLHRSACVLHQPASVLHRSACVTQMQWMPAFC